MFPSKMRVAIAALPFLLLVGCGRPATVSECEEIATRVATLEFTAGSKTPQAVNAAQLATVQARVKDTMKRSCVGKRLTNGAMTCVRSAKTATEIRERCFD